MAEPFFVVRILTLSGQKGAESLGFFQTTEFWAAFVGVAAGFIFSVFGDMLRFKAKQLVVRRQLKKEIKLIKDQALNALFIHLENDKISEGSKEPFLLTPGVDLGLVSDRNLLLEAQVDMRRRQSVRNAKFISDVIDEELKSFEIFLTGDFRKCKWELRNTLLCRYYAIVIFHCDGYLRSEKPAHNAQNAYENNAVVEDVLEKVEKRYSLEIPRLEI